MQLYGIRGRNAWAAAEKLEGAAELLDEVGASPARAC